MEFKLQAKGTVSACREALNAKLASLPLPETQEHKVVRMIAHHIVADYLDPMHDKWAQEVQEVRAANTEKGKGGLGASMAEPPEPAASFSIDCTVAWATAKVG